jgi:phosphoribosylformylglycinamidine synthase subunit PurQ / glutaminase
VTASVGVVLFPGSNCEHDVVEAIGDLGGRARIIWHGASELGDVDAVVLPGGFAHGDYLRPGAIARFSPIMNAVARFAAEGGPVVGICNGFQVLAEAGLLPGALQKNEGLTFLCVPTELEVVSSSSVLTRGIPIGMKLHIPINHFEGAYTCDIATRAHLWAE